LGGGRKGREREREGERQERDRERRGEISKVGRKKKPYQRMREEEEKTWNLTFDTVAKICLAVFFHNYP
jgi:hypothetical protein